MAYLLSRFQNMPKLRPVSYSEFARKLLRAGYVLIRKSKHSIYFQSEKQVTIPIPHKHSHDMPKGLLNKLIKEMGLTLEEFYDL